MKSKPPVRLVLRGRKVLFENRREAECKKPASAEDYSDGGKIKTTLDRDRQDALYAEACSAYGAVIRRLARGYEADSDKQRDLLQEMHLELWMSLKSFSGRCSLQTWVYRIAHNVGASHVMRSRRMASRLVDLETLEAGIPFIDAEAQADRRFPVTILLNLIHQLKPLDREVILLYLEGEAAGADRGGDWDLRRQRRHEDSPN
jgi:RNA polymerase sigma-70 factor (ECF subfamily)